MDETTKALVKVAESLPLKDMYEDAVQPVARETGTALGQVGKLVNSALRPLRSVQVAWDTVFDRLDGWLVDRLSGVPETQLVDPPPNVVGGVVTGLLFAHEETILRDMFVQLLATSMVKDRASTAHPAFAEFIKQMTPLEARLVRAMAKHRDIATLMIRSHDKPNSAQPHRHPARGLTEEQFLEFLENQPFEGWFGERCLTAVDVPPDAPPTDDVITGFGNLERLGLVRSSTDIALTDRKSYLKIAMCDRALEMYDQIVSVGCIPGLQTGMTSVTELGKRFITSCVPRRRKQSAG
jgi:hypothetical protein